MTVLACAQGDLLAPHANYTNALRVTQELVPDALLVGCALTAPAYAVKVANGWACVSG